MYALTRQTDGGTEEHIKNYSLKYFKLSCDNNADPIITHKLSLSFILQIKKRPVLYHQNIPTIRVSSKIENVIVD